MAREQRGRYRAVLALWCPVLLCLGVRTVQGADVSGVVRMPDVCSPAASPAVVYLTPVSEGRERGSSHDECERRWQTLRS